MFNDLKINHVSAGFATVALGKGENQRIAVIDLTEHFKSTENPANEGVWRETLLKRPHLLTLKGKTRIFDNILNGRSAFYNVGRIPEAALKAYNV